MSRRGRFIQVPVRDRSVDLSRGSPFEGRWWGRWKEVETLRPLTIKDAVATVLLMAVGIPYVGYLIRGEMPFIQDPRGMAGVGLVG